MEDGIINSLVIGGKTYDISAASAKIANDSEKLGGQSSSYYATTASLTGATKRISDLESYFTGGVANHAASADNAGSATTAANAAKAADADKLGGQVPGYYATTANLKTATDNITTISGYFTNGSAKSASVASDAEKLGGHTPDFYATKDELTAATGDISKLESYFDENGVAKHAASADNAGSATTAANAAAATSAAAADKLKTARTISASGDVTWSVTFDGSQNKTGAATINNIPSAVAWSAVSAEVNSKVSSVYKVKGTATVAEIKALTTKEIGDVYNVSDAGEIATGVTVLAGDNVVWTGTAWDKLAGTVDLAPYQTTAAMSSYYTKASADSIFQTKAGMTAYSETGHQHTLDDITGTAKTNLVNNAISGAAASAAIASAVTTSANMTDANKAKLAQVGAIKGYVDAKAAAAAAAFSAYSTIDVYPTQGGTVVSTNATAKEDKFALSAMGNNIVMTTTAAGAHPVIGISAKESYVDGNTLYVF